MAGSTAETMAAIRAALDAVEGLDPDARKARLDAMDLTAALRAEIDSLLVARARQGGFLSGSPLALHDAGPAPLLAHGTRLSHFEIEEMIGRGGSAEVFRARRIDNFEQTVAIKVLLDASQARIGYFLRERSILASMEHPGIARIIDGGITENGHPYMVMEYVEGSDLIEHANLHGLDLDQRLRLFRQICDAVSYAHRHLVIHRDLKPANIRVTPQGQVKLLDFGVAKLLASDVRSEQFETATVLTPEFAAPEQLYGEAVTTATDVYALGGVLHYLLSGEPPFDTRGLPLHLAIDKLLRSDPPRLSHSAARSDAPAIPPQQLRGDLDAIVTRAMRRQPAERYSSAQALWTDIEHFLEHRPVEARSGDTLYRLGRHLRRHRLATASAMAILFAGGAFVTQLYLAGQADQRARAAAELQRAELLRLVEFQRGIFARSDPEVIGAAFLEQLRAQLRERLGESADGEYMTDWDAYESELAPTDAAVHVLGRYLLDPADAALEQDQSTTPAVLAQMRDALAWAYFGIGDFEAAAGQRLHTIEALRAAGAEPSRILEQQLYHAYMVAQTERANDASELYPRIIEGLSNELGADHRLTLEARFRQLTLEGYQLPTDEVIARSYQLVADSQRALGDADRDTVFAQQNLTTILCHHGRASEGLSQAEQMLALVDTHHATDDFLLMKVLSSASICFGRAGRTSEAIALEQRNVEIHRRALGAAHPHTLNTVGNLMFALRTADRLDEAKALGIELLGIAEQHDTATMRARRTVWVINLVNAYLQQGDVTAAGVLLDTHLQASTDLLGADDMRILALRLLQAMWLHDAGRAGPALDRIGTLLADFSRLGHPRSALGLRARDTQIAALGALDRKPEALALARQLLDETRQIEGPSTPAVLHRATRVAELELDLGRPQAGVELLQPLLTTQDSTIGRSLVLSRALLVLTQCEIALGAAEDAAVRLLGLLEALVSAHGSRHPLTALTAWTLTQLPGVSAEHAAAAERHLTWLDTADPAMLTAEQQRVRAQRLNRLQSSA